MLIDEYIILCFWGMYILLINSPNSRLFTHQFAQLMSNRKNIQKLN